MTKGKEGKPEALYLRDLYPGLVKVIEALQFGANKHGRDNWKTVDPLVYEEAMVRHALKEGTDEESGLTHLAHAAADALLALTNYERREGPEAYRWVPVMDPRERLHDPPLETRVPLQTFEVACSWVDSQGRKCQLRKGHKPPCDVLLVQDKPPFEPCLILGHLGCGLNKGHMGRCVK